MHSASVALASRYLALTKASTIAVVPRSGAGMSLPPFHLAFPVDDLAAARGFYGQLLGCVEGRSAEHWVDFDFFGHQIVAHLAPQFARRSATNPVDGENVPVPHFGIVLPMEQWKQLAERLRSAAVEFVIEPTVRFEGEPGEQATMFLLDPSGNALEFKAMADTAKLFATE
jgi:extradiol dioxygenase family protein